VAGKNGPPACVNDCPGLSIVTDGDSLACFAKCAVTHQCTSDCDQTTMDLLNSKKSNCGAAPPTPATPPDGNPNIPVPAFCNDIIGANAQEASLWAGFSRKRNLRSYNRKLLWEQFQTDVAGKNGPPACLSDCPGLERVIDADSIACFAVCTISNSCTSDCDQTTMDLLNSKKAGCVNGPKPPPPTPSPALVSPPNARSAVVLSKCMETCPGTDQMLQANLNCQAMKQWSSVLLGQSTAVDEDEGPAPVPILDSSPDARASWKSFTWERRKLLTEHSCLLTCRDDEKFGLNALAARQCDGSSHK